MQPGPHGCGGQVERRAQRAAPAPAAARPGRRAGSPPPRPVRRARAGRPRPSPGRSRRTSRARWRPARAGAAPRGCAGGRRARPHRAGPGLPSGRRRRHSGRMRSKATPAARSRAARSPWSRSPPSRPAAGRGPPPRPATAARRARRPSCRRRRPSGAEGSRRPPSVVDSSLEPARPSSLDGRPVVRTTLLNRYKRRSVKPWRRLLAEARPRGVRAGQRDADAACAASETFRCGLLTRLLHALLSSPATRISETSQVRFSTPPLAPGGSPMKIAGLRLATAGVAAAALVTMTACSSGLGGASLVQRRRRQAAAARRSRCSSANDAATVKSAQAVVGRLQEGQPRRRREDRDPARAAPRATTSSRRSCRPATCRTSSGTTPARCCRR